MFKEIQKFEVDVTAEGLEFLELTKEGNVCYSDDFDGSNEQQELFHEFSLIQLALQSGRAQVSKDGKTATMTITVPLRLQNISPVETTWIDIKEVPKDGTVVDLWLGAPFNCRKPDMVWYEPWKNWVPKDDVEYITDETDIYGTGSDVPTHFMIPPQGPNVKEITTKVGRWIFKNNVTTDKEGYLTSKELIDIELEIASIIFHKDIELEGEEIKFARKALGLKRKDFAHILKVSEDLILDWENGKSPMNRTFKTLICELLDNVRTKKGH